MIFKLLITFVNKIEMQRLYEKHVWADFHNY